MPSSTAIATASAATETVERPDAREGRLARGVWEAPAWLFYAIAAAVLVGGLAYVAFAVRSRKGTG